MDFAAEGLLDDLEGKERAAREKLLERLVEEGFTPEELKAAVAEDRLALLPVERVLGGQYTVDEIERRAGLPAPTMIRQWRLLGLPEPSREEHRFGDADVAAAEAMQAFLEAGLSEDGISEISRVLGQGMARVAATTAAMFAETFLQPGDSEDEVAWRFAKLAEELNPHLAPVLFAAYNAHLRESVRRAVLSRAELAAGQIADEQEMAVCFADLVGFTSLSGEIETRELGGVVTKFGELAADVCNSDVRLVKTIGDGAMLVSNEPGAMVEAALLLLEDVREADLPSVRAGVAWGRALPRAGDLYGQAVNVASRVTGVARPGSVLCTEDVRDAVPGDFDWSYAGKHRLKGVGSSVPLYRARRLKVAAEDGRASPRRADRRRKRESS